MSWTPPSFIAGRAPPAAYPLSRYLPALENGAAAAWLAQFPPGSWILDAFGGSPLLAIEAARAGYRVLVAANNPVIRAMLETGCASPGREDLQSVLADLAASYRGEERIEPHIRRLYDTPCAACSHMVEADAFLWEKNAPSPYARIYHCPHCGDKGERPAVAFDHEKAARFASGGLHRARALERVAARSDPDRSHAEEALAVYLPRAVYALFTLINRLDSLPITPGRRRHLDALLLHALDQACSLWPYPQARERPRQLSVPPRFRENNVWQALEQAISILQAPGTSPPPPVPFYTWPNLPAGSSGIVLFEGRLKELAASSTAVQPVAVLTALPRPNQAFWTLSALWSGWLWGAEAALPLKMVLRRRRYDWGWHSAALASVFTSLSPLLEEAAPVLAFTGEAEPGLLSAALLAAETGGFSFRGVALPADGGQAQLHWQKGASPAETNPAGKNEDPASLAGQAARDFLQQRGQPAAYLSVHCAGLAALSQAGRLQLKPEVQDPPAAEPTLALQFSQLQNVLKEAVSWRGGFINLEGELNPWWLRETGEVQLPLGDRVEAALVRFLTKNPASPVLSIWEDIYAGFPGLLTPEPALVQACLESYAEQEPPGSGLWRLRTGDQPTARRKDLQEAQQLVMELGKRAGFHCRKAASLKKTLPASISGIEPILWENPGSSPEWAFYVLASAAFSHILTEAPRLAAKQIIVLPGSRVGLALYKIQADPRLRKLEDRGWYFMKYRLLRRLASLQISSTGLEEQLGSDPLTEKSAQIRLL